MVAIFKVIGVLFMIGGSVLGYNFIERATYLASPGASDLITFTGVSYIAGSFIIGFLFIGFGRVIELLKDIETNTEINKN